MSTLWIPAEKEKGWRPIPLGEEAVGIGPDQEKSSLVEVAQAAALVIPWRPGAGGRRHLLVVREGKKALVNGLPPLTIRVLRDKDEIALIGKRGQIFFSAEAPAQIEPYPGSGGRAQHCPRCKDEIGEGQLAVLCPKCAIYYHQEADRPCFTYGETCVICGHKTSLGDYSWVPEPEE